MSELDYRDAQPTDDAALRRLLRDQPMPGRFALSFEREPSFFLAAAVEGDHHETLVGATPQGELAGLATRTERDAYLNGAVARLGYLAQVRVAPAFRGRGLLKRGWAEFRARSQARGVPLSVTTIISANRAARAVLEPERPWKPTYRPLTELLTLALLPGLSRHRPPPAGLTLRPATPADLPALLACLARHGARHQLAPAWTAQTLAALPGLSVADFLVAQEGPHLVGAVALWDQRGFKQTVIRGYGPPVGALRPAWNALAPLGLPKLPAVGSALPQAFASHLAVDDDNPAVAVALLSRLLERARDRALSFVALGLCQGHALLGPLKRALPHLTYRSQVYLVFWEEGRPAADALDARPLHLELATL